MLIKVFILGTVDIVGDAMDGGAFAGDSG